MHVRWRNQRAPFELALARALAAPARFALLRVDVDAALWFNDTFGHDAGDEMLTRVFGCVDRVTDGAVFRTDGDVLSVLVGGADAQAARDHGEQIRAAVAGLAIPNPKPPGGPGVVTVSIGGATRAYGEDLAAAILIERARARCHEAKRRGRNCVVVDLSDA